MNTSIVKLRKQYSACFEYIDNLPIEDKTQIVVTVYYHDLWRKYKLSVEVPTKHYYVEQDLWFESLPDVRMFLDYYMFEITKYDI